jgi:hypothetical protein
MQICPLKDFGGFKNESFILFFIKSNKIFRNKSSHAARKTIIFNLKWIILITVNRCQYKTGLLPRLYIRLCGKMVL